MNNVCFIPARGGSKGVRGKNMRRLDGTPLVGITIKAAIQSEIFRAIYVSTDCPMTHEYAMSMGCNSFRMRPWNKDIDMQSANELICSEMKDIQSQEWKTVNLWYLQPTSPFRTLEDFRTIERMSDVLAEGESIISFREVGCDEHYMWQFKRVAEYIEPVSVEEVVPRRQDLQGAYVRDGAFYISRAGDILKNRKLVQSKILGYIRSGIHVNIDSENDWIEAKRLCAEYSLSQREGQTSDWKNIA